MSVQLLSSDEAAQAKESLLKLLYMAMHIHSRDRKRSIEWTDGFSLLGPRNAGVLAVIQLMHICLIPCRTTDGSDYMLQWR